jgi:hypothetical protein
MKSIDYCVCCGNDHLEIGSAYMSAFVFDRMTGSKKNKKKNKVDCKFIKCLSCDFIFTNIRFDRDEEIRHYTNYMKGEYLDQRVKYEGPSNLDYFESEEYKNLRRSVTQQVLDNILGPNKIKEMQSVLDYGGNTGEMIPENLSHTKKYVTDLNSRVSDDGIIFVPNAQESGPVDIVLCGHTFEHVSYPIEVLTDIKTYMKSKSYLIIEVPYEPQNYWREREFHEHINVWNFNSLQKMLLTHGFEIVFSHGITYPPPMGNCMVVVGQLR